MCDVMAIPNPETKEFQGKAGVKIKLSDCYDAKCSEPEIMLSAEQNQKMETPNIPQAEQNFEEVSKFIQMMGTAPL